MCIHDTMALGTRNSVEVANHMPTGNRIINEEKMKKFPLNTTKNRGDNFHYSYSIQWSKSKPEQ